MKRINHIIRDKGGLHARPAGYLVSEIIKYKSEVTVRKNSITVSGKNIMEVMALAVRYGEQISIGIEGADEDLAFDGLTRFLKNNL